MIEINEEKKKKIMQPKNDLVFHVLFGRGKERITKALLEDILKIKIEKLELDNNVELLNDNVREKNGRLDLRAVINGNIECDIEMQLTTHAQMLERVLYYWSKIFTANLQVGQKYEKLRKTICILIVDDDIKEFKEIKEPHTKWQIREEKHNEKVLTQYFEIDIIDMKKAIKEYKENKNDEVLQWMMFLHNPEEREVESIMSENNDIKEAKEELDKIRQDELMQRMLLNQEIARMDEEQRMIDAERKGIAEGEEQSKLEIAKNMLDEKIEINIIAKVTGLSIEKIKSLRT